MSNSLCAAALAGLRQQLLPFGPPRPVRPAREAREADKPSEAPASFGQRAQERATRLFLDAVKERRVRSVRSVRVLFRPFRATLYSYQIKPDGRATLRFHCAFHEAPDEVFRQAAHLMLARTKNAKRNVSREALNAFVQAIPPSAFDLPGARRAAKRARPGPGRHRSLEESFARVNERYFHGQLAQPDLCWSPKRSRRTLGSYQEDADRLIVSRVFDSRKVPLYVLDYLMYHELLHKFLGVRRHASGRRCVHGPDFKRLERRYARFKEAQAFIQKF